MKFDSEFDITSVYNCIEQNLRLNTRMVDIFYVDYEEYYIYIKSNSNIPSVYYDNLEHLRKYFEIKCKIIPGLYKKKEKIVVIKYEERADFCLILTELLHSKSITQYHEATEDWIREGLPHYLAKILCETCNIEYKKSGQEIYFKIWEKIHRKYGFALLRTIIYTDFIQITKRILKEIFNYNRDDILEMPFRKAIDIILSVKN